MLWLLGGIALTAAAVGSVPAYRWLMTRVEDSHPVHANALIATISIAISALWAGAIMACGYGMVLLGVALPAMLTACGLLLVSAVLASRAFNRMVGSQSQASGSSGSGSVMAPATNSQHGVI
ncbi:MAG: hypothetical protein WBO55_10830 [Rhizobiaceae bacterium]